MVFLQKLPDKYKEREAYFRRNVIFVAIIILILLYLEKIGGFFAWVLTICMPFLIGAGLAFILNIISNGLMKYGQKIFNFKESTVSRVFANFFAILIVIALVTTFIFIIFPQLFASIESVISTFPTAIYQLLTWLSSMTVEWDSAHEMILSLKHTIVDDGGILSWFEEILSWIISGGANGLFDSVYQVVSTTFSLVFSSFVSIMFSIILLFNKKTFVKEGKGLLKAYLSDIAYKKTIHVLEIIKKTFTSYVGGTCTECLILGTLVTFGASLLHIPYALLSGVIVAIGALVPMFGALVGAMIASLFIVIESPIHALYFIIMFICIQQVEGNFIYPNVVGKSVGFPPMYVIIAVTIGANVAGVLGMIIFIPVCTCIYQLVKEDVILRLKAKK